MKIISLLFLVLFFSELSAQVPFVFESQSAIGSNASDVGIRYAQDSDENKILFGTVGNDIDIAPGGEVVNVNPLGNPDLLLVKYDETNTVLWSANFGRIALNNGMQAKDLAIDNDGNIIISGSFQSNVNFNPLGASTIQTSAGSDDAFIAKYSPDGMLIWFRQFGVISSDASGALVLADNGEIYLSLKYSGIIDLDPGSGEVLSDNAGAFDTALIRLDSDGLYITHITIGTDGNDEFTSLAISGNNLAAGCVLSGALSGLPTRTMAVFMFDENLTPVWDYNFNNEALSNEISHITFSADGNSVYLGGRILGSTDFDNSDDTEFLIDPLFADPFFAKYTVAGTFQWAKYIRSSGTEDYFAGFAESASALIIAGSFDINAQFIPGDLTTEVSSAGGLDIYTAAYDINDGSYLFSDVFGGAGSEFARNVTFDSGLASVVGSFTTSLALNPQASPINSNGGSDIFVGSFSYDTAVSVKEVAVNSPLVIFPNPANAEISIQVPLGLVVKNIRIFSLSGVELTTNHVMASSGQIQIIVQNLSPGLYIVEVASDSGIFRSKFIKTRF